MGITRQRLILFIDLEGVATDTDIRAAAVEILVTQRHVLTAITAATIIATAVTTTAIATAATPPLLIIGSLSHSLYARPLVIEAPGHHAVPSYPFLSALTCSGGV
ncbi:hypothetical protein GCM10011317_43010 [Niveispirillum cyanobacteriorum]|nr:hypothetical protein GCM10011317_43010 [Niveispirillum cyanobacteriorum]